MPARIAHISDTHLGTRPGQGVKHNVWGVEMQSRLLEHDYYERFEEIFEIIAGLEPKVDLVIHSGDFYNSPWERNPTQPPAMAVQTAITVLKKFIENTGIPVLILEGNHGIYRSLEVSLLDTLKLAVPGLEIATQQDLKKALGNDEPLVKEFDTLEVFCFPFMEYNVLESAGLLEDFNDWITTYQRPNTKKPSVAVAHGMDLDRTLFTPIFSLGYEYIALGHDHSQRKHAKNAWYAGSTERWRFDEAGKKKGFLIVDIDIGKDAKVTPYTLDYVRPVFNEVISITRDDNVSSIMEKVENWFDDQGIRSDWDPVTAARVRFSFTGSSTRVSSLDLGIALETLRMKVLTHDSGYNLVQFVWSMKQTVTDHDEAAYPEIESEYLIEDPEADFKEYLKGKDIDSAYDQSVLTRIAVRALKLSVESGDEHLTYDKISEDHEQ
ncbi:MAG: metallophosphoesterase family protein [Candidatus Thorarchaeota archaeon]